MQCDSRAGLRRICAYLKPSPAAPSIWSAETRRFSISISACPPGIELSIVSSTRIVRIAGSGRSTRNMHAPSSDFAMTMPTRAPSAPVMKLLASVDDPVIAVQSARGLHHRRIGSRAACIGRLGHEERRTRPARHQRLEKARFLFGASDLAEQIHVALVGRHRVAGERPQRRETGLDQGNRGLALREVRSVGQNMRRQHAGLACLVAQFLHQFVARAVRPRPRILLIGDHLGADEGLDLCGNGVGSIGHECGYSGRLPAGRGLVFRSCAPGRGVLKRWSPLA